MNENVIEIVSYLVKKIMHNEDVVENEQKLVQNLVNQGYEIADIDTAFELIFSSELYCEAESEEGGFNLSNSHRVLDFRERFKLSLKVRGLLIRLSALNLINDEELEDILKMSLRFRQTEIGLKGFWRVLQRVVDNPSRLSLIIENSPEFKSFNAEHRKYIN